VSASVTLDWQLVAADWAGVVVFQPRLKALGIENVTTRHEQGFSAYRDVLGAYRAHWRL
jgi:hypothetical protein